MERLINEGQSAPIRYRLWFLLKLKREKWDTILFIQPPKK
jgi:hypothetical protein